MTDERPPMRVGTAERAAALRALDEHLAAGRLDIEEYGERSARAASAYTAPELAALFVDLPAPHPRLPGGPEAPPMTWAHSPVPPPVPIRSAAGPTGDVGLALSIALVVLSPIVLLMLVLFTRSMVGIVLFPVLVALPLLLTHRRR